MTIDPTTTEAFRYIKGKSLAQRDRDAKRAPRYTHTFGGGYDSRSPYVHGYLSLVDGDRARWKRP